jgi:protein SCO1/2
VALLSAVFSVAMLLLAGCGTHAAAAAPQFKNAGTQLYLPLPAALQRLKFTDSTGRTVRLSDYAGKTIVLADGLTLCQEHCPIDTATLVLLAREYAAQASDPSDTVFLTVTVDPTRDTPPQLAAYRKLYVGSPSHLPQWHLLTASAHADHALWSALHVYVQKVKEDDPTARNWRTGQRLTYDIDHSDDVFFIDPTGTQSYLFAGQPYLHGAHVPAPMQRFMSTAGVRNERHGVWTAGDGLQVLNWIHSR